VDTSAHTLTLVGGSNILAPESYAIITNDTAKFSSDWTTFSGTIFKSSFSLTNTDNIISLKDGNGVIIDPAVPYVSTQGAKGDGNSLSRQTDGTWISATPTPGLINTNIPLSISTTTDETATTTDQTTPDTTSSSQTSSNISAHSSPAPLSNTEQKIEFEVSAGRDRLTTIGNNLAFCAVLTKSQNVSEQSVAYYWSFGDGTVAQGKNVNHTYKFAGEYSIVVNANYSDKQAVSRTQVKVISPDVSITKVPGGIEISNNSKTEINLEGWNLVSQKKTFIFPTDTLIPSGKKITFADEVTGISEGAAQLLNPMGKELSSIKKVDAEVLGVTITSKTNINLNDIQAKIEEVKNTIAQVSKESKSSKTSDEINAVSSIAVMEPTKTISSPTPMPDAVLGIKENTDAVANTATVFEAERQIGFVSRLFTWPIKGFNFVRHLFVEE
jgi:hypothetical protein